MTGLIVFALIVIFIAGVMWVNSSSFRDMPGTPGGSVPGQAHARLPGNGEYGFEIVGEASYQKALRAIAGPGKVRHECIATIHLEDENPHDNKAVRVDIEGRTVGYFSRADARRYRKQIAKHGPITSECDALILGGGKGKPSLGVWLDLPTSV